MDFFQEYEFVSQFGTGMKLITWIIPFMDASAPEEQKCKRNEL